MRERLLGPPSLFSETDQVKREYFARSLGRLGHATEISA